jgi:hypothetical protein
MDEADDRPNGKAYRAVDIPGASVTASANAAYFWPKGRKERT